MAKGAIRRKLCSRMVWIGRSIVICLVTTHAGVRRIVVVPVVTSRAIIGNTRMCPVQIVIIVVNRECGRLPTRGGRVAHGAIRRDHQRSVIWIQTRVVIGRVATCASIGCIGIVAVVACITIGSDGYMRSCKGIYCTVIEDGRRPGRL